MTTSNFRCMFGVFGVIALGIFAADGRGGLPGSARLQNIASVSAPRPLLGRDEESSVADSLSGFWKIEISVTDIRTPSNTCEITGNLEIFASSAGSAETVDHGSVDLRRACQVDGEMRELPFEGPVSLVLQDGETLLLIPDCRLKIDQWRSTEDAIEVLGAARCVVQEMRAPRVLEGRWVADRGRGLPITD